MDKPSDNHHVLSLLQALSKASKSFQTNPICSICHRRDLKPAIEAISELGKEDEAALSSEPYLSYLSQPLTDLKTLFARLEMLRGRGIVTLFRRLITTLKISEMAYLVEARTKSITDKLIVENLLLVLRNPTNDESSLEAVIEFRDRLSRGFDKEFQELVLSGRVFNSLEHILADESARPVARDEAALTVLALVDFNKNVFVGLVLLGPTIPALISIASVCTIQVLCSLIGRVKTIVVDAIEVPRVVSLLDSGDLGLRLAAMNAALEMACFGSRETVEAMIVGEGLVKKLMELQREMERVFDDEKEEEVRVNLARGKCAVRLAAQVEVSESLDKREKRELRSEILRFVGDYSESRFEFVSFVSEVFWGSSF